MRQLLITRAIFILAGMAAFVFFFPGFGAVQAAKPEDPLADSERVKAEKTTLEDKEVKKLLKGKRFQLLHQTKLAELPKQAPLQIPRRAEVRLYNYTDDEVVQSFVDLKKGTVVRLKRDRFQPSLDPEELDEAFRIAQDGINLEGHEPEGLIVTDPAGEPCSKSRCVELQFVVDGQPSSLVVVVNLSTETGVRVRGI